MCLFLVGSTSGTRPTLAPLSRHCHRWVILVLCVRGPSALILYVPLAQPQNPCPRLRRSRCHSSASQSFRISRYNSPSLVVWSTDLYLDF